MEERCGPGGCGTADARFYFVRFTRGGVTVTVLPIPFRLGYKPNSTGSGSIGNGLMVLSRHFY